MEKDIDDKMMKSVEYRYTERVLQLENVPVCE